MPNKQLLEAAFNAVVFPLSLTSYNPQNNDTRVHGVKKVSLCHNLVFATPHLCIKNVDKMPGGSNKPSLPAQVLGRPFLDGWEFQLSDRLNLREMSHFHTFFSAAPPQRMWDQLKYELCLFQAWPSSMFYSAFPPPLQMHWHNPVSIETWCI